MNSIPNYRTERPYLENRELSWLKFNYRVLEEAMDTRVPLCERLTFAQIFCSNLDEFFMVRVGSLYDQMLVEPDKTDNKTGMTAREQLNYVFKEARELTRKKDKVYKNLMSELKKYGIEIVSFSDISNEDSDYLGKYFETVLPLLSPQIVGKKQPFPFIGNREIYAVALLGSKNSEKIGLVPCSNSILKRLVPLPSNRNRYILMEELILHFMPKIFDKYVVKSKSLIRIIRNADIDVDEADFDEELDYRDSMELLIRERKKLCPVKIEYSRVLDEKIIVNLCKELKLKKEQIYYSKSPLDLSFIFELQDKLRNYKELFFERRVPQQSKYVKDNEYMMTQIAENDILLSYPYESMQPFIRLLREAGRDERVVSIKMTLYRVAKNSQIVEALIDAAENGKEVVVLVELRARFDEENNIEWSRRLEAAGCRIIYGIDYTKVHSKLCLITYMKDDEVSYITQIGTGNYNEKTSKLYTDLSLMTANFEIGQEASKIFMDLCIEEFVDATKHLLVAPLCFKSRLLEMMQEEIDSANSGNGGYIGIKVNSLTDKDIIDKLIQCSKAGVKVDMVVRGICCLVPGVCGYTDNISVVSIVGRYLEHSRIFIFGKGEREKIYIASADFMTRNMDKRVEVATPVYDSAIKDRIRKMFHILRCDTIKGRELMSDGRYIRRTVDSVQEYTEEERQEALAGREISSQDYFIQQAYDNASV